ncbi:MAG: inositol monophosphatase family protein [Hyphomicrobiaceae bacterium]
MDNVDEFVGFALELADASRAIAARAFADAVDFTTKQDGSPVTEIDQEIERVLVGLIGERFPGHGILGEEYGSRDASNQYVWVVDPIDGTKSFATGLPTFGTLISLCRSGLPILGIIELPISRQRCVGAEGRPTEFNGAPVRCRAQQELQACVMCASGPEFYRGTAPRSGFERLWPETKWNVYGGGCTAYASLARGLVDICLEGDNLSPFDYCALVPVVHGAGGRISDWAGNDLNLRSGLDARANGVLASGDSRIHDQALRVLNET